MIGARPFRERGVVHADLFPGRRIVSAPIRVAPLLPTIISSRRRGRCVAKWDPMASTINCISARSAERKPILRKTSIVWLGGFFRPPRRMPRQKRSSSLNSRMGTVSRMPSPGRRPGPLDDDADLDRYAAEFKRAGRASALNFYRAAELTWHEMAPWRGAHIQVPAAFIAGDHDVVVLANPDIVQNFPKEVPHLRGNQIIPNCGHWTQQERPDETNRFMLNFLKEYSRREDGTIEAVDARHGVVAKEIPARCEACPCKTSVPR